MHGYSLLQNLSASTKIFDPMTLTSSFDLHLKKNLALALTFEPKEIGLSYYACVLPLARPSCLYQNVYP